MVLKKNFDYLKKIGREIMSYAITDPAGEISLFTAYKLMDNIPISIPLFLFSAWHIPYMIQVRRKLDKVVKISGGLTKKVLEPFNKSSWCAHRVAISYSFGQGKYNEFKKFLNQYPPKYYTKKLEKNVLNKIKEILVKK